MAAVSPTAPSPTSPMSPDVRKIFDKIDPEYCARAAIRCNGKTEYFDVKKSDRKPVMIEDNSVTFEGTTLSMQLQSSKAAIRVKRSGPIELAIHTESGRAYASTEDGKIYKTHADGSVKIKKAAKGEIHIQTGSSVCLIV